MRSEGIENIVSGIEPKKRLLEASKKSSSSYAEKTLGICPVRKLLLIMKFSVRKMKWKKFMSQRRHGRLKDNRKRILPREVREPISAGSCPDSELVSSRRSTSSTKLPNSLGIVPEKKLNSSRRDCSLFAPNS